MKDVCELDKKSPFSNGTLLLPQVEKKVRKSSYQMAKESKER